MKILQEKIIEKPDESKYGFIYITQNNINKKCYIGKSKYNKRGGWKNYYGSGKLLIKAINKYGKENFSRYIIRECNNEEELIEQELYYLDKYKAYEYGNNFYNIANTSGGGWLIDGYSESQKDSYREKMSNIMKEKSKDENYIKNVSNGVKKAFSKKEVKEKQSKSQINRYKDINERIKTSNRAKEVWSRPGIKERYRENNAKKIYRCNKEGDVLEVYPSMEEAVQYLGIKSHVTLRKSIKNNLEYKGYYWKRDE